jgi:hypothetical protein
LKHGVTTLRTGLFRSAASKAVAPKLRKLRWRADLRGLRCHEGGT